MTSLLGADPPCTNPPTTLPWGLRVDKLQLAYNGARCLNNVSLNCTAGSITGLVGPNSSGKSALAQVLTQWRPVDSGNVHLVDATGAPISAKNVSDHLWYNWQPGALLPEKRISHQLSTIAAWMPTFCVETFQKHLHKCGIASSARPMDLSQGKRSALALSTSLAVERPILILDEPFTGMDASTKNYFTGQLIDYADSGDKTIILADHNLDELERLISEVIVLAEGCVHYCGEVDDLVESYLRVEGRSDDVSRFCQGHDVISRSTLGVLEQVIVARNTNVRQTPAGDSSLQIQRVSLAEAITALTHNASDRTELADQHAKNPTVNTTAHDGGPTNEA